ncbi:consortin, connexin sorting protein b isoform X2 [Colossoma macropomum]|uniref:consortin, connexin sorting protein b isoform X2 n=1 Tax=Colossoma macropomum TaxID=42526 RepID=UPI0018644234|nr:consortin, connexin sorting protein b isoform X2 [Colossoma macropomum]
MVTRLIQQLVKSLSGAQDCFDVMGDPKTEEAARVWSESTDAIVNPDLSVSDENQNRLKETEPADWGAAKQDMMSNNPEEKPENEITKLSLDGSHFCRAPGPSPSLLAALRSLGEHSDHMLLPHSLHQIAEAYFLEEDYTWAVQFLRLERLYHERLLSNLASLQQEWESQWKADAQANNDTPVKTDGTDAESKSMDSLSHICRTHQRPNRTMEKDVVDLMLKNSPKQVLVNSTKVQEMTSRTFAKTDDALRPHTEPQEGEDEGENEEEEEEDEEEDVEEVLMDKGLVEEVQGEEEEARGEPLRGEELAKLIEVEEMFPSNGLVSILKKRACQEEDDPANRSPSRSSFKRKVRFSEMADGLDNDEVGGASCLVFLLLCLVTVAISMGGTALYCLLGGAYSNVCADFSQNMDFYFGPIWRSVDTIIHWFSLSSS